MKNRIIKLIRSIRIIELIGFSVIIIFVKFFLNGIEAILGPDQNLPSWLVWLMWPVLAIGLSYKFGRRRY